MKLATRKNGTRDGELVVVAKDLRTAVAVSDIACTLQQALDDWSVLSQKLHKVYKKLNNNSIPGCFEFAAKELMAPLPRAYQWLDGSSYVNHVELVRKARGVAMPDSFWTDPLMYQGGSDAMLGPADPIQNSSSDEDWGLDMEAEVAVITDDVALGMSVDQTQEHIKLITLVNDISLRNLIPGELGKGFGFVHGKPSTAFSPVAVTPDELEDAWRGTKLHLPLNVYLNAELIGKANAGQDMVFNFAQLIAHATKTRSLGAGTIIGSGTVSNKSADGGPGLPISEGGSGYSCLAEVRTVEKIRDGEIKTPFMQPGDRVSIEMLDENGASIFGTIDQTVL